MPPWRSHKHYQHCQLTGWHLLTTIPSRRHKRHAPYLPVASERGHRGRMRSQRNASCSPWHADHMMLSQVCTANCLSRRLPDTDLTTLLKTSCPSAQHGTTGPATSGSRWLRCTDATPNNTASAPFCTPRGMQASLAYPG